VYNKLIIFDYLKENFKYNPLTGDFIRLKAHRRVKVGDVAGWVRNTYRAISIKGVTYYSHRLAWLYMTGDWPQNQIDHINRNRLDNSWSNLREANNGQNQANSERNQNKTGFKGVTKVARCERWQANISVNNEAIYLGIYKSPEEAYNAYCEASRKYFGDFANV
jgi:hypothetical protein